MNSLNKSTKYVQKVWPAIFLIDTRFLFSNKKNLWTDKAIYTLKEVRAIAQNYNKNVFFLDALSAIINW